MKMGKLYKLPLHSSMTVTTPEMRADKNVDSNHFFSLDLENFGYYLIEINLMKIY